MRSLLGMLDLEFEELLLCVVMVVMVVWYYCIFLPGHGVLN